MQMYLGPYSGNIEARFCSDFFWCRDGEATRVINETVSAVVYLQNNTRNGLQQTLSVQAGASRHSSIYTDFSNTAYSVITPLAAGARRSTSAP